MHIHILGICGTFMGGLAALAKQAGHHVTGCDVGIYPPMSDQLHALHIDLVEGYGADQIAFRPDVFVVGNVVSRARLADGLPRYPLMEAILDAGLPYTSGPQWLREHILYNHHVLAVAGTHGKTSTASMLAWILEACNKAPGFLIGGVPRNFDRSARLGGWDETNGKRLFVIESDEYDTAFFDKRSKFMHYRPNTLIMNNLEFDHADIFSDLAAIEQQFSHLLRTIPRNGRIIVNGLDESLARVLNQGCWSEVRLFGAPNSDYTLQGDSFDQFTVLKQGAMVGQVQWGSSGQHNRLNALAAIAAAEHVGIEPHSAIAALSDFRSVKRRMEARAVITIGKNVAPVTIWDDFAHHPTAIRTTIDGLRQQIGADHRILAIFEPRSNTMKQGTIKAQLPWSLANADLAFCYSHHLDWDAKTVLAPLGDKVCVAKSMNELIERIVQIIQPGDQLLCMSNGSFDGLHDQLIQILNAKYP